MLPVVIVGKVSSGKEETVKLLGKLTGAKVYSGSIVIKSEILAENRRRAFSRIRLNGQAPSDGSLAPLEIKRETYRLIYKQCEKRDGEGWLGNRIRRTHFFADAPELILEGSRDLPDIEAITKDGGILIYLSVRDQIRFNRIRARGQSRDAHLTTIEMLNDFEREEAACLETALAWAAERNGKNNFEMITVTNEAEGVGHLESQLCQLVMPRLQARGWTFRRPQ